MTRSPKRARVALVTDSTSCLPPESTEGIDALLAIVPLNVTVDGATFVEGETITRGEVAEAQERGAELSTSRPAPARVLEAYEELVERGATHIVSVHAAAQLSSTVSSARLAAAEAPVPVEVIDSSTLGMAMGFAVMAGLEAAAGGAEMDDVAARVREVAAGAQAAFYVDSLEPLRRGGRVGRAGALLGSALSIKPLLTLHDGVIEPLERVRTTNRAMDRLVERTRTSIDELSTGGPGRTVVAVHSLARQDLAADVLARLQEECGDAVSSWVEAPLGAVVTVHVGAGTVACVVARLPEI